MNKNFTKSFLFLFLFLLSYSVKAQYCNGGVPTFIANLTGSPDSAWISPPIQRNDFCCGANNPDKCIEFILTLDPNATAISFDVCVGAKPPGALFYQIDCGPQTPVGSPICLTSPGPHHLTFCKPGNNINQYCITSISSPSISPPQVINDGCTGTMTAANFDPATVTWNSISPGVAGAYNSYLSCPTCTTTNVTAQPGYPPFVDYQVCGLPLGSCSLTPVCLVTRMTFNPTLIATIAPLNPTVCFGSAGTTITANGAGGTPPYTYTWSTGATTQSIFVGPGTYSVVLQDATNCPPTTATVTVTSFSATITANAGADINTCNLNPTVTLNGSVTGTTTGIWSGGGGTFNPLNTTLNATYTPTAAELASGSVTLTLTTTGNGTCPPGTDQVTINYLPFQGTLSTSVVDVSCNGGSNGQATVIVTGTATPYTYSWTTAPVQTTATATGLPIGTYTVTVRDNLSCPLTTSVTINQAPPLTTSMTHTDVSCFFGSDGTATVTAFGGTPGYTYSWNTTPVQTTATATGLSAGSYTVTVRDANNCPTTATVTLVQPTIIVAVISKTDATCNGTSTGTATVTTNGGAGGYTYVWTPSGNTAQTATGLAAGGYTVTVTDANGCVATANTTIGQPLNPLTITPSQTNVTCNGLSNGTATATPSGGTPGYTYSWNTTPVQTTQTATGLAAGNYAVTVTDANGCTAIQIYTITQPPVLNVTTGTIVTVSCFGGTNGTANVFVSGGTAGYTYSWSTTPVQTTPSATNLSPGTYTVTVTDANGCSASNTAIIVTQPGAALAATVTSQNNVSCYGANDGSVTVSASGGTAPYTYSWAPVGGTATTASNLAAGSYTLTVTDARGCINTVMANITAPSKILLALSKVDATCNASNGQATVVASGGVPGYTYNWTPYGGNAAATPATLSSQSYTVTVGDATGCVQDTFVLINNLTGPTAVVTGVVDATCNGDNNGSVTIDTTGGGGSYTISWNTTPVQTGLTASGLTAGNYIATVADTNGCTYLVAAAVNEPPALVFTTSQTPVSCFGGGDGTATVNAYFGSPGYTYSWSTIPVQTDTTATGLSATSYTVTITDSHSCQIQAVYNIAQPAAPVSSTISGTDVNCKNGNDGTATVVASGGTSPYFYNWAPNGATAPNISGLSTGNYNVLITDVNGCTANNTIFIDEPVNPLTSSVVTGDVSCAGGNDGFATVTPSGGTAGYSYSWTPAGDINQTSDTLTAGTYFVTITDNNGCQALNSAIINEPPVLVATIINPVNTFCAQVNGQADVSVSGGTPGYTYSWNSTPVQNTSTADSLAAGSYTVIVTDALGCVATDNVNITDTPAGTANATVVNHVSCFGGSNGSAQVAPVGGVAPFTYSWAPTGGNSTIATNLFAGTYTVTITDSKNCVAIDSVTITEPALLTGSASATSNVSCSGGNNGTATATAADGTAPYSYSWNSVPSQSTQTAVGLPAGTYTVVITDSLGCFVTDTATITEPTLMTSSIASSTDVTCFGSTNGTAIATPAGGTPGYTYSWSSTPVQINDTAIGLAPGAYKVIITDALGCKDSSFVTINEPLPVVTTASANTTICRNSSTPITGTATGGSGTYFYLWDNSLGFGQTQNVTPQVTTDYIVTAYDLNGCPGNPDTVTISVIRLDQSILFVGGTTPICPGATSIVYAQVNDSSSGPLTYSWNNGLGSGLGPFTVIPTQPTTYIVTVTNSCGVSIIDSARVDFHPLPVISSAVNTDNGCSPLNVQFTDFSSTPSGANIAWSWDFGDGTTSTIQNPIHTYVPTGTYDVYLTVTSGKGCISTSASPVNVITVNPSPTADFTPDPTTVFLPNGAVQLFNQSTGGVSYEWNFGDGSTSTLISPSHVYGAIGTYTVTLITTNQFGCKDTAYKTVIATSDIVFPTAFTPNGSGPNGGTYSTTDFSNDVFFPYTSGVDEFHLLIFNRWGELIFETFDVKIGWDGYYRGKLCEQDVYVWKAFATFHDGRVFDRVGDVTLLR